MRLFRRRTEPPPVIANGEPVEPVPSPRRFRMPRLPFAANGRAWLVIIGLIVITVFALLLNQRVLPPQVVTWWPLAVAVPALIWFLAALVRRETRSLLGSTALLGLSVSMLLAAQNIASLSATWVGITFIAVGTGIVLRGLLLRHQPIG
jgi:hypothetical protein